MVNGLTAALRCAHNRSAGRSLLLAWTAVLFTGCGDGGSDPHRCPIPPTAAVLIEQVAMKSITDLSLATLNASQGHRAVSHHILGRPWGNIAFMTLAPAAYCLGPDTVAFEPSCKSDVPGPPFPGEEFLVTYDACSRGGCETAGKAFMDAYFTVRPARAPEHRHPLEYVTTDPPGHIRYDPNPFVTTRYDLTNPALVVVSAELRHKVTFTPAGGDPLDISHIGTAMATQRSGKIQTLSLLVFFTGLTAAASPVVLSVEGNETGNVHGAVRTSTGVLASIEGHFDPRAKLFSWHQPCALGTAAVPASQDVH
jgi:hypothetical protein